MAKRRWSSLNIEILGAYSILEPPPLYPWNHLQNINHYFLMIHDGFQSPFRSPPPHRAMCIHVIDIHRSSKKYGITRGCMFLRARCSSTIFGWTRSHQLWPQIPKSIWQKPDSQPVAPQGVDVVERVKMEEYLQQWCVSQDQGAPKILWGYKKLLMDSTSCRSSKETLFPDHYSSDSIFFWGFMFNFQGVPTEVLTYWFLNWHSRPPRAQKAHHPKLRSAPFEWIIVVLETEKFKQLESSNLTKDNNNNNKKKKNKLKLLSHRCGPPIPDQKSSKFNHSAGFQDTFPAYRSGARVAWTAWPFQVPSGKRSTWSVFKESIGVNQIIGFRKGLLHQKWPNSKVKSGYLHGFVLRVLPEGYMYIYIIYIYCSYSVF